MSKSELLLTRLDQVAWSVQATGHALAVIGLGSSGRDSERLDDYSDLDFFVVAEDGFKQLFLDGLDWLDSATPLVYQFRNTVDGYKVLFKDEVFCEFAVFERDELRDIPFAPGRIVWKRPDVNDAVAVPAVVPRPPEDSSAEWLIGEALTNLYVGLSRFRRGERLSAARMVQHCAVDRVIELHELNASETSVDRDPFSNERRIEQRFPDLAEVLPSFVQGYEQTPASAEAILDYLSNEYAVNSAMTSAIRSLCDYARSVV